MLTILQTTLVTTIQSTNVTTTLAIKVPKTISTTKLTTISTTMAAIVQTTSPTTILATIPTTISTSIQTKIANETKTIQTTFLTTIITNKQNNTQSTVPTIITTTQIIEKTELISNSKNIEREKVTDNMQILSSEFNKITEYVTTSQISISTKLMTIETTIPNKKPKTILETNPTTNPLITEAKISTNIPSEKQTTINQIIDSRTALPTTNKVIIPSTEYRVIQTTITTNTPSNKIFSTIPKTATIVSTTDNILSNLSSEVKKDLNTTNQEIYSDLTTNLNYFQSENSSEKIIINNESSITLNSNLNDMIKNTINTELIKASNIISTINEVKEETDLIYNNDNDYTLAILLGINYIRLYKFYFSFNIYFITVINNIYSNKLIFPITVIYNSNIRLLKELGANCTLRNINTNLIYQYFCLVETETSNIRQIKINPEFIFLTQNNIKVISITPFAKMYMNNLELIDDKYDDFDKYMVYIIDNSTYKLNNKKIFDITGSIKDLQPNLFINETIKLMINIESDKKPVIEVDCIIINITGFNYTLTCKSNETFYGDLQSAISFMENNDILLIYFGIKNNNSLINIGINSNSRRYFRFKLKDIKTTTIVTVTVTVTISIMLAITIGLIIFVRKKYTKSKINEESTLTKFNI